MTTKTMSMLLCLVLMIAAVSGLRAEEVTPPDEFFGFQLGADRKIARWDAIVEYYEVLAEESDKILVTDMGPTTNGQPFLLVVVSSAENLQRLDPPIPRSLLPRRKPGQGLSFGRAVQIPIGVDDPTNQGIGKHGQVNQFRQRRHGLGNGQIVNGPGGFQNDARFAVLQKLGNPR